MTPLLASILIFGIPSIIFPIAVFGNPYRLFFGILSNKEFNSLITKIFTSPDFTLTEYHAKGAGHDIWLANRYYGFSINGVKQFSYFQKRKVYNLVDRMRMHGLTR